jgi:hypothetical protein
MSESAQQTYPEAGKCVAADRNRYRVSLDGWLGLVGSSVGLFVDDDAAAVLTRSTRLHFVRKENT